jgi:hypothetical protein
MYYRRTDGAFFIWWEKDDLWWNMSALLGIEGAGFWKSPTTAVTGTYSPVGTYTGSPIVVITP